MNNFRNQHRNDQPRRNWVSEFEPKWIKDGIDENAIKFADDFGKFLSRPLSSSQIRNVYGELKRIQMKGIKNEKTSFLLLKPKLAYAAARDNAKGLLPLKDVFNKAFDAVETSDLTKAEIQFENFMDFMEAILAYHKSYGGKQ